VKTSSSQFQFELVVLDGYINKILIIFRCVVMVNARRYRQLVIVLIGITAVEIGLH
jgi:hypothetical protein